MQSRYELFSYLISVLYRNVQKIERDEMVQYGCKGSFAQYLAVMKRHPDGVTSAQLCEICDRDKAAVSRAVAEMEDAGLVRRRMENETFYRARLILTDAGREAAEFVSRRAVAAVEAAGKGLSDEDRKIFYATLELIASNLQQISKTGIPQHEEQKGKEE